MHLYENIASRKRYVNRSTNTILRLMISKQQTTIAYSNNVVFIYFLNMQKYCLELCSNIKFMQKKQFSVRLYADRQLLFCSEKA